MRKEAGERRDFLPRFVLELRKRGATVLLEHGYGSAMGYTEQDYMGDNPDVRFGSHEEAYQQDQVLVLRFPSAVEIEMMKPGACLISMIHYPTRPQRIEFLRSLQLEAISLDSLKDDSGRRLVENLRDVAWNGIEIGFRTLQKTYPEPGCFDPARQPIRVTLLGAGAVGSHVVPAAVKYGDEELRQKMVAKGAPGVQVTVVDYDLTNRVSFMQELLSRTDMLVDATQRPDPTIPVIPNEWISFLPEHAVIVDLSVDPYDFSYRPPQIKGIEGIPHGDLDQYVFAPDDPAYDLLPQELNTANRRNAVSCYSWPGIHPRRCMLVYGAQLLPVFRTLIEKGGVTSINPQGSYFERAISRALLSQWISTEDAGLSR